MDVAVSDTKNTLWKKRFKLEGKPPLTALSNRLRAQLDAAGCHPPTGPILIQGFFSAQRQFLR